MPEAGQRNLIAVNGQKGSGYFYCYKATISNQNINVPGEELKLMEKYFNKVMKKQKLDALLNMMARSN